MEGVGCRSGGNGIAVRRDGWLRWSQGLQELRLSCFGGQTNKLRGARSRRQRGTRDPTSGTKGSRDRVSRDAGVGEVVVEEITTNERQRDSGRGRSTACVRGRKGALQESLSIASQHGPSDTRRYADWTLHHNPGHFVVICQRLEDVLKMWQ